MRPPTGSGRAAPLIAVPLHTNTTPRLTPGRFQRPHAERGAPECTGWRIHPPEIDARLKRAAPVWLRHMPDRLRRSLASLHSKRYAVRCSDF